MRFICYIKYYEMIENNLINEQLLQYIYISIIRLCLILKMYSNYN